MILLKNSDQALFTPNSKRLPETPCCKNPSGAEMASEAKMQRGLLCDGLVFILAKPGTAADLKN